MASAVGIDLGTTNTVVAAVRDGVVVALRDESGERLLPSVVSFLPSGSVLVGRSAVERRLSDAANTIYSVKRLIGRPWGAPEVESARSKLPFLLREGQKGATVVATRGEAFSLPELSAFVLRRAKAIAEEALGEPVERSVITVPANFNDLQRAATKTAGRLAGLDVLRILNEPTAAALAYGPATKGRERVAVYDLGGGTFDITLLDLAGNVFEVMATAGDSALGGDDIDLVIAERMADDLNKRLRFDARANPAAYGRLRLLAEAMKRQLSDGDEHEVSAADLVPGEGASAQPWRFRMTRPELEWASLEIVERTFRVCRQALEAAGMQPGDLDRVILVGGSTRMPMVARKVAQFFGRPPIVRINPDEVVALGAAIQAEVLDRSRARRAGENAPHPSVSNESVLQTPAVEAKATIEIPDLPVVRGKDRAARRPPPPLPRRAGAEPPSDLAEFLPGSGGKPLVFDVPAPEAPAHPDIEARSHSLPDEPPADGPPEVRPEVRTAHEPEPAGSTAARRPEPALSPASPPKLDAPRRPGPPPPPPPPSLASPRASPPVPPANRALSSGGPPGPAPKHGPPRAPPNLGPPLPPPANAPLLIDVTPLSLGVETVAGFCDVLIEANTPVPCDRTRSFSTASDGQTAVHVRVAQGPSKRFQENTFLGELELSGLVPAPRGQTQIAVTFEIDPDGILNVGARDEKTGRRMAARIRLVGDQTDANAVDAMRARQAAHPLADPSSRG
ncbi:MAG: Hsp70 family protein [Polyangiaceae bacterium]|jgi:molecular chaperone DnaK